MSETRHPVAAPERGARSQVSSTPAAPEPLTASCSDCRGVRPRAARPPHADSRCDGAPGLRQTSWGQASAGARVAGVIGAQRHARAAARRSRPCPADPRRPDAVARRARCRARGSGRSPGSTTRTWRSYVDVVVGDGARVSGGSTSVDLRTGTRTVLVTDSQPSDAAAAVAPPPIGPRRSSTPFRRRPTNPRDAVALARGRPGGLRLVSSRSSLEEAPWPPGVRTSRPTSPRGTTRCCARRTSSPATTTTPRTSSSRRW